jgi:hypothetical protein
MVPANAGAGAMSHKKQTDRQMKNAMQSEIENFLKLATIGLSLY